MFTPDNLTAASTIPPNETILGDLCLVHIFSSLPRHSATRLLTLVMT